MKINAYAHRWNLNFEFGGCNLSIYFYLSHWLSQKIYVTVKYGVYRERYIIHFIKIVGTVGNQLRKNGKKNMKNISKSRLTLLPVVNKILIEEDDIYNFMYNMFMRYIK